MIVSVALTAVATSTRASNPASMQPRPPLLNSISDSYWLLMSSASVPMMTAPVQTVLRQRLLDERVSEARRIRHVPSEER
jgi:hypothetical protein